MRYRFGLCGLVPDTRELWMDDRPRPVEPQVFDLLLLLRNRGRVVSQDELIRSVWDNRIVSDSAIAARISAARAAIGDDGTRQAWIKTVPRRGFRFVGAVEEEPPQPAAAPQPPETGRQRVALCRSADGTRIAYATSGGGYPLVKAGHWLTHLEHDWHSPIWRPALDRLNRRFRLVRYDQRGNGLSDWTLGDCSLERFVYDLEAVVEAAGLDRFALYGTSQGAPIAVAYSVRHPGRISHLVLQGGFEQGRLVRGTQSEREQGEAILTLIRHGWGKRGSPFINAFAALFIPEGSRPAARTGPPARRENPRRRVRRAGKRQPRHPAAGKGVAGAVRGDRAVRRLNASDGSLQAPPRLRCSSSRGMISTKLQGMCR